MWIFALILMWSEECDQRQAAHSWHLMTVPWRWSWCRSHHNHHILTISTIATFPTCNYPVSSHSPARAVKPLMQIRPELRWAALRWEWSQGMWAGSWRCETCLMGTTRLSSSQPGCKVCSNTNIDSTNRPELSAETLNWSQSFLFTDPLSWGGLMYGGTFWPRSPFSPLTTIHLPSLYRYRVPSSWQKSVSGWAGCLRKTNEATVNFLPVFRSNNVLFRFTKKQLKVKTVIFPKQI